MAPVPAHHIHYIYRWIS